MGNLLKKWPPCRVDTGTELISGDLALVKLNQVRISAIGQNNPRVAQDPTAELDYTSESPNLDDRLDINDRTRTTRFVYTISLSTLP